MQLAELQTQFFKALVDNNIPNIFKTAENILPHRLKIYQDSISETRIANLSKIFNASKKIVGEDYWRLLAETFVIQQPSLDNDMATSAQLFPKFVATHPVLKYVPYLADFAQLEYAWHQCFHQAILFRPTTALAQAIEYYDEQLIVELTAGVQVVKSIYPLNALWAWCQQPIGQLLLPDDLNNECYFILYREHDRITIDQVLIQQWQIIELLLKQKYCVIDLCAEHQQHYHDALDTEALKQLVTNGIISWRL